MKRILVGGCAALLLAACAEDPSLFVGGPSGPATRVQLSHGKAVLLPGQSLRVGATVLDEVGNVTADAPSFSACSGAPVTVTAATGEALFSGAADIVASSTTLGEGCVNVSGGGQSDTIHVTVAPAGVRISGDPFVGYNSQDPAANAFQFTVDAFDAAGASLTGSIPWEWTSSAENIFYVDRFTGMLTTRGLGSATLRLVAPGGADHSRLITVGAPAFNGTSSASSGGQGDLITVTRTGGPELDANTQAYFNFGNVRTFIDGPITADQMRLVVPATGVAAARGDIVLRNVGPDNLDRRLAFQATTGGTGHRHSPASDGCATAPSFSTEASPEGWIYFSFVGGSVGYGGTAPDIWFAYTNSSGSADSVDVRLEWLSPSGTAIADADLFAYIGCGTAAVGASQDYNPPEPPEEEIAGVIELPAGATLYVRAVIFAAQGAAFSNARVRVQ